VIIFPNLAERHQTIELLRSVPILSGAYNLAKGGLPWKGSFW